MSHSDDALPGYKAILTTVGGLYALLAASTLAQGAAAVLAPFGVPAEVLRAPHFLDFFHFLFVHMSVLGVLLVLLGQLVEGARKQRWVARVLLLAELHYTYLDLRTSVWGNGLYAHEKSLVPVAIDLVVVACLLYLSLVAARTRGALSQGGA